jgi:hypothetical protein
MSDECYAFGPDEIDEHISLSFEMHMKIFLIQTSGNIPVN